MSTKTFTYLGLFIALMIFSTCTKDETFLTSGTDVLQKAGSNRGAIRGPVNGNVLFISSPYECTVQDDIGYQTLRNAKHKGRDVFQVGDSVHYIIVTKGNGDVLDPIAIKRGYKK